MLHNEQCNPANTPPMPDVSKSAVPAAGTSALCPPHDWVVCDDSPGAENGRAEEEVAAQQGNRPHSRGQNGNGEIFEADAADHNGVQRGDCLSGPGPNTKVRYCCSKCPATHSDIDHLEREPNSKKVTATVSVKSGRCDINKDQLAFELEVANKLGFTHKVKLQAGAGAEAAKEVLKDIGFDMNNVITI